MCKIDRNISTITLQGKKSINKPKVLPLSFITPNQTKIGSTSSILAPSTQPKGKTKVSFNSTIEKCQSSNFSSSCHSTLRRRIHTTLAIYANYDSGLGLSCTFWLQYHWGLITSEKPSNLAKGILITFIQKSAWR